MGWGGSCKAVTAVIKAFIISTVSEPGLMLRGAINWREHANTVGFFFALDSLFRSKMDEGGRRRGQELSGCTSTMHYYIT